ncbi:hypothetical protein LJ739_12110 [Aestuariibacter halophilus]|uniref:RDD domain-containing protein n=1 Tax=Fluctibacter halophilus TaxID=226011 RepID=A0ABS8G8T6_9ALTE|nr:hypothetical protein [Aestuariibacter halophilus]MCC2616987.1 hypothetical protein [Aestuariibacter halophilus]
MSDNPDPLQRLWQSQQTQHPDLDKLRRDWRLIRYKQISYMTLDILGLLTGPLLLWLMAERMHWFEFAWLVAIVVLATPLTGYVLWQRRDALRTREIATQDYLVLLLNRSRRNVKIARVTRHSVIALVPMFFILHAGVYWLDAYPMERWLNKVIASTVILVVLLPAMWLWARRRERRFEQESRQLQEQIHEQ